MQYIWFTAIGRMHKINILWHSPGEKNQILPCLNPVWKKMNFKYFRTLLNKLLQNAWKSCIKLWFCHSYYCSPGTVRLPINIYIFRVLYFCCKNAHWTEKSNNWAFLDNISFQKIHFKSVCQLVTAKLKANVKSEKNSIHKSLKHNCVYISISLRKTKFCKLTATWKLSSMNSKLTSSICLY